MNDAFARFDPDGTAAGDVEGGAVGGWDAGAGGFARAQRQTVLADGCGGAGRGAADAACVGCGADGDWARCWRTIRR